MTKHGAQPDHMSTRDALQAFADDTRGDRIHPATYRKSRLKIVAGIGAAGIFAFFGISHLASGEEVDAANNGVAGHDKAATEQANPDKTASEVAFGCKIQGINLDRGDITDQGAQILLDINTTGRDNVTYRTFAFIEGALDTTMEVPMHPGTGTDEKATVTDPFFGKRLGLYAISGADSTLCGAFRYAPNPEDIISSYGFDSKTGLPPQLPAELPTLQPS